MLMLARDMNAEFIQPARESDFAIVRGRTHGCVFELRVESESKTQPEALVLLMRHWSSETVARLDGSDGAGMIAIDPAGLRTAIEHACHSFATGTDTP